MNATPNQFLDLESEFTDPQMAGTVILPIPYEGGASWGKGAAGGPSAIIKASHNIERYDDVYQKEIHRDGIATLPDVDTSGDAIAVMAKIRSEAAKWIENGKFFVSLGGDHSATFGAFKGAQDVHSDLACIQIDAHTDLRDTYQGDSFSHACVMSRIRELNAQTLHLGIRSTSAGEAQRVLDEQIEVVSMQAFYNGNIDIERILNTIGERVYLSIDVDCMDWSVIRSTGTPEPGGFTWREILDLLEIIFKDKDVVACDVMELAPKSDDVNSAFAAARLAAKLIAMKQGIEHIGRMDGLIV